MKVIDNRLHGFLDYITVLCFALIPRIFALTGMPAYLSYALAAVHFLMTILTDFELGVVKVIALKIHKWVEMVVGPALLIMPWMLGFSEDMKARCIFLAAGMVIIVVGQLSKYESGDTNPQIK